LHLIPHNLARVSGQAIEPGYSCSPFIKSFSQYEQSPNFLYSCHIMETQISRFQAALLFLTATGYRFAKDVPKLIEPANDNYYKRGHIFVFIIEYALLDIVINHLLKWNLSILFVVLGMMVSFQLVMSFVYNKKLEIIMANYYTYYSGYLYAVFLYC